MADAWPSVRQTGKWVTQAVDETVAELRGLHARGLAGVLQDAAESVKEIGQEVQRGLEVTADWLAGAEEGREAAAPPPAPPAKREKRTDAADAISTPSAPPHKPQPTPRTDAADAIPTPSAPPHEPQPAPRLEDLRRGQRVYRKGLPAEVVNVDCNVEPPSLLVRMLDTDREVGTVAAYVSLSPEASQPCLCEGCHVCLVDLHRQPELNTVRGIAVQYRPGVDRWNVSLLSGEVVGVRSQNLSVLLAPYRQT